MYRVKIALISLMMVFLIGCSKQSQDYPNVSIQDLDEKYYIISGILPPNFVLQDIKVEKPNEKYSSVVAEISSYSLNHLNEVLCSENIVLYEKNNIVKDNTWNTHSDLGKGMLTISPGYVSFVIPDYYELISSMQELTRTVSQTNEENNNYYTRTYELMKKLDINIQIKNSYYALNDSSFLLTAIGTQWEECYYACAKILLNDIAIYDGTRLIENGFDYYIPCIAEVLYVDNQLAWLNISGIYDLVGQKIESVYPLSNAIITAADRLNKILHVQPISIQEIQLYYLPHVRIKNDPRMVEFRPTWCFSTDSGLCIYVDAVTGEEVL